MEIDILPSPPPVEETLAQRRARRQAILAKYAGSASANLSQAPSPSPRPEQGTSSAVHQPPLSTVPVADLASSQPHSVIGMPGTTTLSDAKLAVNGEAGQSSISSVSSRPLINCRLLSLWHRKTRFNVGISYT